MMSPAPRSPLFPYTTLFRSAGVALLHLHRRRGGFGQRRAQPRIEIGETLAVFGRDGDRLDRKSTRLNSSHLGISYAVFCLKKKRKCLTQQPPHIQRKYGKVK